MAADVTMLVGNGYTPGHAALALELYRQNHGVRSLIDPRVSHSSARDPRVEA
jgi:L-erythro-3,5-diaminohexanoate dehydrogenase